MTVSTQPWWKDATVYQIYPASFKDTNGDGIGDLPGILSEIDYIKSLGADVIWICPMYNSPQCDMGYDISDFESVYPPYGTIEDMDCIIAACHERGMRIILDLVINHTSDQHDWFKESRSSKDSPKRDWYIWRPARHDLQGNRQPPNNWASCFGGSAWQWDEFTQEYYLHLFCPEQPDLNWENAETRAAIFESSMHFWLRKGIDGFRIDVVNMYDKAPGLPDAPITNKNSPYQMDVSLFCNGPRMGHYLTEMQSVLSQYGVTMTVGELPATWDRAGLLRYVSAAAKQLNMVFQFDVVGVGRPGLDDDLDIAPGDNWAVPDLAKAVANTQNLLRDSDGWTTVFLENHDQARSVSRWGSDATEESRVRSAKLLATLCATLSGTLFIYQGQEIGMVNAPPSWTIEEYKDVATINNYNEKKQESGGDPKVLAYTMASLQRLARDHSRIPFSWNASPNAGFTIDGAKPWMRVHDNHRLVNAKQQIADKDSVLSFWKRVLFLRKKYADVLVHGIYEPVLDQHADVYMYIKKGTKRNTIVALNFSNKEQTMTLPAAVSTSDLTLVISSYGDYVIDKLRSFEAVVWLTNK